MKYIWINPVTDKMYEQDVLNEFLEQHGFRRFYTTSDWLTVVKEKYRLAVKKAGRPVIDVRCPKIKKLLEELNLTSQISIPEIDPILIHCGQEASEREYLLQKEKIITTPCEALANMGNELALPKTCFISWNQFLKSIGSNPIGVAPNKSPIPPGFFDKMGLKTVSITGEEEIRAYFQQGVTSDVQLVELLYCKDGCHNGDGIEPQNIGTCES